jgi:hypothetical protein
MTDTICAALIGAIATVGAVVLAHILAKRNAAGRADTSPQPFAPAKPSAIAPSTERRSGETAAQAPSAPTSEDFHGLPQPVPILRVVQDPTLANDIANILRAIEPAAPLGGITIARPPRARALIYVGPCPKGTDNRIRNLVEGRGLKVSSVRDLNRFGGVPTATMAKPLGY